MTASVGVAANKLIAKVGSDAAKPDGLLVVEPGSEAAFLAPRPIRELPMIGPRTAEALAGLGIHTIGQLAALPLETLRSRFGSHGVELHHRAHGRHEGEVLHERARARSMSRESTFQHDITDPNRLRGILRSHAERVAASLAAESLGARTVTLKLRFPPFETITRSRTPGGTITLADELYHLGVAMFEDAWAKHGSRPVRLLGLGATGLVEAGHQLRFGEDGRDVRLAGTLSELRQRFGDDAVRHGNELRE
ncbi:MAG: hypothetical protein U5Q44_12950 [Dehalococcoidia bacterium]|nr:hypothetical protein [Dehalococcoidia bacterium]